MTKVTLTKESILIGCLTISEVQCIIILVEHGGIQKDMMLLLRVLHLNKQEIKNGEIFFLQKIYVRSEIFYN